MSAPGRAMRDSILSAIVAAALSATGAIYAMGRLTGQQSQKIETLETQVNLLQVNVLDQLRMISDGMNDNANRLDVLRCEQSLLHGTKKGCER